MAAWRKRSILSLLNVTLPAAVTSSGMEPNFATNPTISKTIILAACKAKWLGERKNISPNNKAAVEFFIKRAFLKRNGESEAVRSREDHASGDNHREGPKV